MTKQEMHAGKTGDWDASPPDGFLRIEREQEWVVIHLPKHANSAAAVGISTRLQDIMEDGEIRILIDASKLESIDSLGINTLLRFWIKARALGGSLQVRCLQGEPLRLFKEARILGALTDGDLAS